MTLLSNLFAAAKTATTTFGSTTWSWISGKARLIIEYVLIGIVVSLAGFTLAIWLQRRELAQQVTKLSGTVGTLSGTVTEQANINRQQDAALAELSRLRGIDSKALTDLNGELAMAGKKGDGLRQRIAQLEKNNADARALLDTPVPADLGCLLDGRPCPATAGHDGNQGRPPASR